MARYTANLAREHTDKYLKEEELLYPQTRNQISGIYAIINFRAESGHSHYRMYAFKGLMPDTKHQIDALLPLIKEQLEYDGYSVTSEYDDERDATFYIIKW